MKLILTLIVGTLILESFEKKIRLNTLRQLNENDLLAKDWENKIIKKQVERV